MADQADAASIASKRPSPEIKQEPGGSRGGNDSDPYDFPTNDDALNIKSPTLTSPVTVLKRPDVKTEVGDVPAAPANVTSNSHSNDREDTEMEEAPAKTGLDGAADDAGPSSHPASASPAAPAPAPAADVVMDGTDESERPLKGVKTVPKAPGADQVGQKKPPEGQDVAASSSEGTKTVPDAQAQPQPQPSVLPPPPPSVPLRKPNKLKRMRELHKDDMVQEEEPPKKVPSMDEQARDGLRRALVLALDHVGFSSATKDALESFVNMTETYLQSLAEDVSHFTYAARRTQPLPLDFDESLARFNLKKSALRPHLRNPVAKSKLRPSYFDPLARYAGQGNDLPLLGEELSGKAEKDAKAYIPAGFPDFPSIHTYRHTPVDVDTVTVKGSGLRYDDGSPVVFADEEVEDTQFTATSNATTLTAAAGAPLVGGAADNEAVANGTSSDPKRIREAAAIEAKQAEEALRGLMRASKINKLKEVRAGAERNKLNKQRFSFWEAAMRELVQDAKGGLGGGGAGAGSTLQIQSQASLLRNKAALREEIADQSMMVNAEKPFHRKEIPRIAKKLKKASAV